MNAKSNGSSNNNYDTPVVFKLTDALRNNGITNMMLDWSDKYRKITLRIRGTFIKNNPDMQGGKELDKNEIVVHDFDEINITQITKAIRACLQDVHIDSSVIEAICVGFADVFADWYTAQKTKGKGGNKKQHNGNSTTELVTVRSVDVKQKDRQRQSMPYTSILIVEKAICMRLP
jgi:hypothetical protein